MSTEAPEITAISSLINIRPATCTGSVDYLVCFRSALFHTETIEFLSALTTARTAVAENLRTCFTTSNYAAGIAALENYAALLFKLMSSLNSQPPVRLDAPLVYGWQSPFDGVTYQSPDIVFDLVMVLFSKVSLIYLSVSISVVNPSICLSLSLNS